MGTDETANLTGLATNSGAGTASAMPGGKIPTFKRITASSENVKNESEVDTDAQNRGESLAEVLPKTVSNSRRVITAIMKTDGVKRAAVF